ncbi:hypothetical protein [Pseudorhodobacter ferrugineus]|uniref:hypothetical protein n=1 Tax=Pseudorhodobacter ferrugineus TaxID=77008 RepID=UPI0003B476A5|nr:hypothetical protein [Pseudorhodobacter ferrugineus]
MGAVTIQQMGERISALLTERLQIKGRDLADKLKRGGGRLPRKVRVAAQGVATATEQSYNPKLLLQINEEKVAENYDICIKHLNGLNKGHKLRGVLLGLSTSILFSLVAVAALVLGVLVWRGFL